MINETCTQCMNVTQFLIEEVNGVIWVGGTGIIFTILILFVIGFFIYRYLRGV